MRTITLVLTCAVAGAIIAVVFSTDPDRGALFGFVVGLAIGAAIDSVLGRIVFSARVIQFLRRHARRDGGLIGATLGACAVLVGDFQRAWLEEGTPYVVTLLVLAAAIGLAIGGIMHGALARRRWRFAAGGALIGVSTHTCITLQQGRAEPLNAGLSIAIIATLGAALELWLEEE